MNVLVTGASGFLGKYILQSFDDPKYFVSTIGRSESSTFKADLSKDKIKLKDQYELVIHAAGKAHMIPNTKEEAQDFYNVNLEGTKNLLKSFKNYPNYFVFISSVSVYGLDSGVNIDEESPLKAVDPYGNSKVLAENEVIKWGKEYNVKVTILRLPLLLGYNAPGNLKAIINGVIKRFYFNIGSGGIKKSMVLAEDVTNFIPKIIKKGGIYNLTDGYHPSFKELSLAISRFYKKPKPISLNYCLVLFIANISQLLTTIVGLKLPINKRQFLKLTQELTFADDKAIENGWKPSSVINTTSKWLRK
jgi:nucleoside-diphosphate-sugar epimerase